MVFDYAASMLRLITIGTPIVVSVQIYIHALHGFPNESWCLAWSGQEFNRAETTILVHTDGTSHETRCTIAKLTTVETPSTFCLSIS